MDIIVILLLISYGIMLFMLLSFYWLYTNQQKEFVRRIKRADELHKEHIDIYKELLDVCIAQKEQLVNQLKQKTNDDS